MRTIPAKRIQLQLAAAVALLLAVSAPVLGLQAAEQKRVVDVVVVSEVITPPIGEYLVKSIRQATESGAEAIVIQLDTPGGLDLSMRDIIKECLNAAVPVVVYVSPSGARAASAAVEASWAPAGRAAGAPWPFFPGHRT